MGLELCWELDWHQVISTKCWFFDENAKNTKFLLVGWRMSGTEFVRETIRENFPSTSNIRDWGKTHTPNIDKYLPTLLEQNTKVFLSIADPRDVAAHILDWRGGQHIHHNEDEWNFDIVDDPNHIRFLEANLNKMVELIEYIQKHFDPKNVLILRYEDAVNNRLNFLWKVADFLNENPLNVDNTEKYLPEVSIYKPIGSQHRFRQDFLDIHTEKYYHLYKTWGYKKTYS